MLNSGRNRLSLIEFWQQPTVTYNNIGREHQEAFIQLDEKEAYSFFRNLDKQGAFIVGLTSGGAETGNVVITSNRNTSFDELATSSNVGAFVCSTTDVGAVKFEKQGNRLFTLRTKPQVSPNGYVVSELLKAEYSSRKLKHHATKGGKRISVMIDKVDRFVKMNNKYVRDVEKGLKELGLNVLVKEIGKVKESDSAVESALLKVGDCHLVIAEQSMTLHVEQHTFPIHNTSVTADYNELLQLLSSLTGVSPESLSNVI